MSLNQTASVGVLMLDTRFERVPGDVGNPATFPFPVAYRVVGGADERRVVHQGAEGLLDSFVAAGEELAASGVRAITTSCGFLALFQPDLAARLPVPVAASSLLLAPLIESMLPGGKRVGILTYAAEALTPEHLGAVSVAPDTPRLGFAPESEFRRAIAGNAPRLPVEAMRAESVALARALIAAHPEVGAILCECSNMPPYSADIAAATGLPVFDLASLITLLHAGFLPKRY